MKTDPVSDSWSFLLGTSPDQEALGAWRLVFVALFAALLAGSVLIAAVNWTRDPRQRTVADLLAWLFRLSIGIMWFQGSIWKLPLPVSQGLQYWTEQMAENAAYPFIGELVRRVALPNMAIFDPLVFLAEFGLAASYMLGVAVRPIATLGALYALGLWLGLYRHPAEWPWEYIFLATVQALFAVYAAGESLGLDGMRRVRPGR